MVPLDLRWGLHGACRVAQEIHVSFGVVSRSATFL